MNKLSVHWFRRDLRLEDNHGLSLALESGNPVLPIFIFDSLILDELDPSDARLSFIHKSVADLKSAIQAKGGDLLVLHGNPEQIWHELISTYNIASVYTNQDYEPYARKRDEAVKQTLKSHGIHFTSVKDQVIFAKNEVVKDDGKPYTVYTPYKNKYRKLLKDNHYKAYQGLGKWHSHSTALPSIQELGFKQSQIELPPIQWDNISDYDKQRDFPAKNGTSHIGPHLRFGTISVRSLFRRFINVNDTYINELIWREFFMQILFHYPQVVHRSFRPKYDHIDWINDPSDFERWSEGKTGYPIVDAGMRELNATGYMHNRVRMVVASFLCKHLLIDWRWGEAYFAEKLLDYELASNNGNWQWAAGTGCDAAPYFRVFNPSSQEKKFDPAKAYINRWVPELNSAEYPRPMVEHAKARQRALDTYKKALDSAT